MTAMKLTLSLLAIVFATTSAMASPQTIAIGNTRLVIPPPASFAPVTPEMAAVNRFLETFVPPTNTQHVTFLSEGQIETALKGEMPSLDRLFTVQTAKQLEQQTVSLADFAQMKEVIRKQNATLMAQAKQQIPAFLDQADKSIEEQFDVRRELQTMQTVPLQPHEESERTFAYSMFTKAHAASAAGQPAPVATVATVTLAFAKGQVLFLYCYGKESDLGWSRKASHDWATAIMAANSAESTLPTSKGFATTP